MLDGNVDSTVFRQGPEYEWSCQVCGGENPAGRPDCATCGSPGEVSSVEIDGRRRAWKRRESYFPEVHDVPEISPESGSAIERLSLGKNRKARLLGHLVRRVGAVVAIIWIAIGLVLRLDLLLLVSTAVFYVLLVEGMRSFFLGKEMRMEGGVAPAEPGWTGRRFFVFLVSVVIAGLIMYVMVVEVIQGAQ